MEKILPDNRTLPISLQAKGCHLSFQAQTRCHLFHEAICDYVLRLTDQEGLHRKDFKNPFHFIFSSYSNLSTVIRGPWEKML